MKIRTGFVSNSSSSSFVCMGIKLTPEIKKSLKEKYPKKKSEYFDGKEDEEEWLLRVCDEILDLAYIDLETRKIIGVYLASDGDDASCSMAELQKTMTKLQEIFGQDVQIKLYMGTEMC